MPNLDDQRYPPPDPDRQSPQRAYEQRAVDAGGKRMPGGTLPKEVVQAIDYLMERGYAPTQTGVLKRAALDVAEAYRRTEVDSNNQLEVTRATE